MRWSRIKNIIILLLVVVNGFLLALVGFRAWRTQQGERETRERMIEVLANNGITFLPQEVPGEMPLSPRQVSLEPPGEERWAELVGEIAETGVTGTWTTYIGAAGQAAFSTAGEVELRFFPGQRSMDQEQLEAYAAELFLILGVSEVRETDRRQKDNAVTVTYTQLWEGAPVPELSLTVYWEDGELTGLSGRCLVGTESPASGGEAISASTALTRFLKALNDGGYVCSQITDLYAGYVPSGTGTVSLSPAWFIETDVWPWRFTVDGATGAVTAAK